MRASSHYSKELIDVRATQILALLLYVKKQDNNQFTVLSLPHIQTKTIKLASKTIKQTDYGLMLCLKLPHD